MAEMNLGRIGFVAKGNFDPNKTDYKRLDQVTFEGSSFFARVNNPTGIPMVDNSNPDWQLSAQKGQEGYAFFEVDEDMQLTLEFLEFEFDFELIDGKLTVETI